MDRPSELSIKCHLLSNEYKEKMRELGVIKRNKVIVVMALLPGSKSIKEAELKYAVTEDGQKEIELTYYTKGLIEEIRALKQQIAILQSEAYNSY